MRLPRAKPGRMHKAALGLINSLELFDERFVPDFLGGGVVCWAAYNRYELTVGDSVEFIATSSVVGAAATIARGIMIDYLTARGEGRVGNLTRKCLYCGHRFLPTHPGKKYCCNEHKYKMQLAKMRKN